MIISAMLIMTTFIALGTGYVNAEETRSDGPVDRLTLWEVETAYQTGGASLSAKHTDCFVGPNEFFDHLKYRIQSTISSPPP